MFSWLFAGYFRSGQFECGQVRPDVAFFGCPDVLFGDSFPHFWLIVMNFVACETDLVIELMKFLSAMACRDGFLYPSRSPSNILLHRGVILRKSWAVTISTFW